MAARGIPPKAPNPFVQQYGDQNFAGRSESVLQPHRIAHYFDCYGPDSTITLAQPLRAHMIEVTRVWFTLKDVSALPVDNTVYLCIEQANTSTASNIFSGRESYAYNPVVDFNATAGDTAQEQITNSTEGLALIIPLVTVQGITPVTVGSTVMAKNDSHYQLAFPGNSAALKDVRIKLLNGDRTTFNGLNGSPVGRLHVEMYVYGETRT